MSLFLHAGTFFKLSAEDFQQHLSSHGKGSE